MERDVVIIGGGAAGFFAAIATKTAHPEKSVVILEKSKRALAKVLLTGGGRCNLTHICEDPEEFSLHYPRGSKELLAPFHHFQPSDTMEWFESRGVPLTIEEDGRVFPQSNRSETIVHCLMEETKKAGIELCLDQRVVSIEKIDAQFKISLDNEEIWSNKILVATGSSPDGYLYAKKLGHTIVQPVPSLFALQVPSSPYLDLSGLAVNSVRLRLADTSFIQEGALLFTHFGFSGPSVLKLSSFAARFLHEKNYKATLLINWLPHANEKEIENQLLQLKTKFPERTLSAENPFGLPKKLWKKMVEFEELSLKRKRSFDDQGSFADLAHNVNVPLKRQDCGLHSVQSAPRRLRDWSHKALQALSKQLHEESFIIEGKTTHKEEFVTAGGVTLKEINFKTMESKICPGLFFAGEILDIDGLTGGFNLQNCWTTGFIAGSNMI